jgi:subtilisin family serine protease
MPERSIAPGGIEDLFIGSEGGNVQVAVIDSGVQLGHPHILSERIDAGVAIDRDGSVAAGVPARQDLLGHGTAVTAAIQERAPGVTIVPVRIFGKELRATPLALAGAIEWAVAAGVDLINLSLGSVNIEHRKMFETAVAAAAAAGIVVVAARSANGVPCVPGILPQVIGVELDWECPRDFYRRDESTRRVFLAAGYPRPIPGVPMRRNLHGVSFAVAALTGFAARAVARIAPGGERIDQLTAVLDDEALTG